MFDFNYEVDWKDWILGIAISVSSRHFVLEIGFGPIAACIDIMFKKED